MHIANKWSAHSFLSTGYILHVDKSIEYKQIYYDNYIVNNYCIFFFIFETFDAVTFVLIMTF